MRRLGGRIVSLPFLEVGMGLEGFADKSWFLWMRLIFVVVSVCG